MRTRSPTSNETPFSASTRSCVDKPQELCTPALVERLSGRLPGIDLDDELLRLVANRISEETLRRG
jgi:hypothetical protein